MAISPCNPPGRVFFTFRQHCNTRLVDDHQRRRSSLCRRLRILQHLRCLFKEQIPILRGVHAQITRPQAPAVGIQYRLKVVFVLQHAANGKEAAQRARRGFCQSKHKPPPHAQCGVVGGRVRLGAHPRTRSNVIFILYTQPHRRDTHQKPGALTGTRTRSGRLRRRGNRLEHRRGTP